MVDMSSFQIYTCKLLFLSELDIAWDFCVFALGDSPGLQIYWFRENVNSFNLGATSSEFCTPVSHWLLL